MIIFMVLVALLGIGVDQQNDYKKRMRENPPTVKILKYHLDENGLTLR